MATTPDNTPAGCHRLPVFIVIVQSTDTVRDRPQSMDYDRVWDLGRDLKPHIPIELGISQIHELLQSYGLSPYGLSHSRLYVYDKAKLRYFAQRGINDGGNERRGTQR